ncbi:hypothetical protein SCP_0400920 [Sparassis crispa]|uniref:Uncharacterized protein n=1 Tax=Sparassis crispa TaxID=139825 RepID=A0A401GHX9_9APHY|nr:hypothetical protein SCP_0400920 [Sparassis crispa]GBE81721.1 hypothetical protein SCP_0400920 [Sparassis crispa]
MYPGSAVSESISADTPIESPSTPVAFIARLRTPTVAVDPKLTAQLQQQTKQLEEQDVMITTLNEQLTHCESDLQAHMDRVAMPES